MTRQSHLNAINWIVLGANPSGKISQGQARHIRRFNEQHRKWWEHENVVGICLARKLSNGKVGRTCVQVLVEKKLPRHRVDRRYKVPETLSCPAFARELLTDVRAVGRAQIE